MASPFSWSDTVQIAFSSCIPCLKPASREEADQSDFESQQHNPAINRIRRARPDELQGLLADNETDIDAETLSLHSNPGRERRNKKKKRSKKNLDKPHRITLFGYDLFGKPSIHLAENDNDALYSRENGSATPNRISRAHSTASTFDSDAAPLDPDTIAALSTANATAAARASAEAEEQRLKDKEERKQRRREKRELKRLAGSPAAGGAEDFEGFQGSGEPHRGQSHIGTMFSGHPGSDSGSGSGFSGSASGGHGEYGPFVAAPGPYVPPPPEDDEDEAADLDGGLYARKTDRGKPSNGGSDSRSRTSASASDRAHQFPDPRNVFSHLQSQSQQSQFQPHPGQERKKKKSSKSSASRTTKSHSSSTSQSPSLPSPVSPAFPSGVQQIVSPSTVEQGQGFFDLEDEIPTVNPAIPDDVKTSGGGFPAARLGGGGAGGGFPMTGFGGSNGMGTKRSRDFGAFLARRGDEEVDGL
ncbi:hypothetical protein B0H34DRAFT_709874 [Crassisporium funariophilum]|nr:hypothetical protein B0H34DRAFT_709874 [Crassisporium funariophilum]